MDNYSQAATLLQPFRTLLTDRKPANTTQTQSIHVYNIIGGGDVSF